MQAYESRVHAQPLQLFETSGLALHLLGSPQYLLWSFLSLTLRFSTPEFYHDQATEAIDFYMDSAHRCVLDLTRQGVADIGIIQALCLLALSEILGMKTCVNCYE